MFSSWPLSAFVAGLKIGGSRRSLSRRPAGSGSPARVPLSRYSFQADPARYVGRAPRQVDEFLDEVLAPILAGSPSAPAEREEVRV